MWQRRPRLITFSPLPLTASRTRAHAHTAVPDLTTAMTHAIPTPLSLALYLMICLARAEHQPAAPPDACSVVAVALSSLPGMSRGALHCYLQTSTSLPCIRPTWYCHFLPRLQIL